ncbi:non-histone chromosomal protein 6 [Rhizophagus clarus]|uniref:Non-histone chromosomal protein 6 n=1 Tax=Rhizophagus clarus TaxID=94130 RepID=A0A8H3QH32_9GLOM|nr:non-histone chromosomal protein 6 [Rhizophagus clarus]
MSIILMPKAAKTTTTTTKLNRKASAKQKVETAKKATKKSAKKDSSDPKRNLTAYMFFSKEYREKVKQENPKASFGEIGKLLGKKWKDMSDKEKVPYVNKAEEDKKRYEKEKAAMGETGEYRL